MARLHFKLEGRSSDLADFGDFSYFSAAVRDCLRSVHRVGHPRSGAIPKFSVAELSVSSAVVCLDGDRESVDDLVDAIVKIRHRLLPKHFTFEDVRTFQKLARPLEHSAAAIQVQSIPIDQEFVDGCIHLLDSGRQSIGEAIGSLDGLNVHAYNFFRLYPEGQNRGVECVFESTLFDQVQAAIKKRVVVRGLLVRDLDGVSIHRIPQVESIEILPPADQTPPITDLFGLFEKTPISFKAASDEWY